MGEQLLLHIYLESGPTSYLQPDAPTSPWSCQDDMLHAVCVYMASTAECQNSILLTCTARLTGRHQFEMHTGMVLQPEQCIYICVYTCALVFETNSIQFYIRETMMYLSSSWQLGLQGSCQVPTT